MKKVLSLLLVIMVFTMATNKTKAQVVEEGNLVIDAYYGWPNLYTTALKALYTDEYSEGVKVGGIGPLGGRIEYMLSDVVGVGVDFGYVNTTVSYKEDIGSGNYYNYEISAPKITALFKMNFHFSKSDKVDAFGGIGVGWKNRTFNFKTNDPDFVDSSAESLFPVGLRASFGVRYFLTENIGLGAEIGLGGPLLSFGISTKF